MSLSPTATESRREQFRAEAIALAAAVLGIKCLLLVLDPHLRIYLGDSGSYLHAAATDWVPPDRSFTYPWLVSVSAVATRSAFSLVMLQSLFGVVSCLLLFWLLRRVAGVGRWYAAIPAVLLAVEPSQLFFERMLMAEAAGGMAMLACIAGVAGYVRSGHWGWVPAFALAGLVAVSMRLSLLPVVLGLSALAPVLRSVVHAGDEDRGRPLVATLRLAAHLVLVLAVTGVLHSGFKQWHASVTDGPADYLRAQGQMRLGLVAPLVRPEHLTRFGLPASLVDGLRFPLDDPRRREAHIWMEGGLWSALRAQAGSDQEAQTLARKISVRALQSDPLGLLRLGLANLRDYFDPEVVRHRLDDDLGLRPPDAGVVEGFARLLAHDVAAVHGVRSVAFVAFEHSRLWLTAVLFALAPAGLGLLIAGRRDPRRGVLAVSLVLGFAGLGMFASHLLFSHIVSFRYLHPMPPVLLASLATLLAVRSRAPATAVGVARDQSRARRDAGATSAR